MFERASRVADAVLREGHVLYPYRPSALKNRMRWQFGVLGPPALADAPGADASWCATEVVCGGSQISARVRFLGITQVDESGWERSEVHEVDLVVGTEGGTAEVDFHGGSARLERFGPFVRVQVENTSDFAETGVDRQAALVHSLIAVHVIVACADGAFASAVDPAPQVAPLVQACSSVRLWPVLVGADLVLACPIILYDNPEIAPESVGDWGDATEIEEMLALRVLTLTDEEKEAAIRTDPFGAAIIGQAAPSVLPGLHGRLTVGSTVVLRPRPGADAHDLFLDGRRATVVGHSADVDGGEYVQVVPDDDPGRDLHQWFGRSWFFRPDEVEPS